MPLTDESLTSMEDIRQAAVERAMSGPVIDEDSVAQQDQRLAATRERGLSRNMETALGIPDMTYEELRDRAVQGAGAATMVGSGVYPFADTEHTKAQYAKGAADVSDLENARLDKEYYRAMGEAGQGTKQMERGARRMDFTPVVDVDGGRTEAHWLHHDRVPPAPDELGISERARELKEGKVNEIYAAGERADKVSSARVGDDWSARFGREVADEMELVPYRMQKGIEQRNLAQGMDDVFKGLDKNVAGKARMKELQKIGKVALKSAYVSPWGAALGAIETGAAIPMAAIANYGRVTDPQEQMLFFALEGTRRPLTVGDLSADGIEFLATDTAAREQLYDQGALSHALYRSMTTKEGRDEAMQQAKDVESAVARNQYRWSTGEPLGDDG